MEETNNLPEIANNEEKYNPFTDPNSVWYREGTQDFRPTRSRPLPSRKCSAKKRRTGEPCQRWALAGMTVCQVHGGNLPSVKERSKAMLEAARLQLMDSVPDAISVVYGLAMNEDTPDAVRLASARDLLDRAGVKGGQDININISDGESPTTKLYDKLASLRGDKPQELEDLGEQEEIIEEASD